MEQTTAQTSQERESFWSLAWPLGLAVIIALGIMLKTIPPWGQQVYDFSPNNTVFDFHVKPVNNLLLTTGDAAVIYAPLSSCGVYRFWVLSGPEMTTSTCIVVVCTNPTYNVSVDVTPPNYQTGEPSTQIIYATALLTTTGDDRLTQCARLGQRALTELRSIPADQAPLHDVVAIMPMPNGKVRIKHLP